MIPATHLLDTSVYCQPIKPKPLPSVEARWRNLGDGSLAISTICDAEVLYGVALSGSAGLAAKYENLLKNRLTALPVDEVVAAAFGKIKAACRKKGRLASDFDFLIAATATVHGLIVATLNVRHFEGVDGLAVEDWSIA